MITLNFTPFPVLQTERLLLRALEPTDDKDLFVLRSDDVVNKYLEGIKHKTIVETQALISKILSAVTNNESIFWVIELRNTREFIGTICLWNISVGEAKAETGYLLHPDFHRMGYMHEALTAVINYGFQSMKLQTIEAHTHKDNAGSVKLLQNNNFKEDTGHVITDESGFIVFALHS